MTRDEQEKFMEETPQRHAEMIRKWIEDGVLTGIPKGYRHEKIVMKRIEDADLQD